MKKQSTPISWIKEEISMSNKSNLEAVAHYFFLVDHANDSQEKFDELIAIYSDDVEAHSNDGSVSYGKKELIKNTRAFYDWMKGGESRHFYNVTKEDGNIIEADWAVSAKLADGNVMALAGHNVYEFNEKHQIKKLVVTNK